MHQPETPGNVSQSPGGGGGWEFNPSLVGSRKVAGDFSVIGEGVMER